MSRRAPPADTLLTFERARWRAGDMSVCGVDEVGLGPLAGPVVAAAVVLPKTIGSTLEGIDDSKRVSAAARRRLADAIRQVAVAWALGAADEASIDASNIYQAARLAAQRAVLRLTAALGRPPCHLLLDAHPLPAVPVPQTTIVHGDGRSQSIAAASILAKVARDAHMQRLGVQFPGYGFEQHAGYPTRAHRQALERLGPCPAHRRSFRPVALLS